MAAPQVDGDTSHVCCVLEELKRRVRVHRIRVRSFTPTARQLGARCKPSPAQALRALLCLLQPSVCWLRCPHSQWLP